MKTLCAIVLLSLFVFSNTLTCLAQPNYIGIVKSVSGEAYISQAMSSQTIRVVPNMKIIMGDLIRTGSDSSVGLIFEDDTVLSLGAESEIVIQDFLFNPKDKELSFIAKMIRGTFSFISGQIGKLAPENVRLETPDATLGIRGTKFLVKID